MVCVRKESGRFIVEYEGKVVADAIDLALARQLAHEWAQRLHTSVAFVTVPRIGQ